MKKIIMSVFAAVALVGCISAEDDLVLEEDSEALCTRNCNNSGENGFTYPIGTAGINNLKAGFNHVQGYQNNTCAVTPLSLMEKNMACGAWGAVFEPNGSFTIKQAQFTIFNDSTNPGCPSGYVATYYVRHPVALGCQYVNPFSTPGSGYLRKCVSSTVPQTDIIDWQCPN
ncbi:MAG: hypothetical protein IPL79_11090 [Myxococcales bacterium]|nr:hypothetical protein [Myxococcales bacterium]